uniref:DUF6598 domain-containing protein n=1 Tax=Oryza punctata TaxID=4537 RepID=A0A0E0L1P2_ORYPU
MEEKRVVEDSEEEAAAAAERRVRAAWAARQEKALRALHIRELTEYDPGQDRRLPSAELGPPFDESKLPVGWTTRSTWVLESNLGFPISVFGTVVIRDQEDTLTLTGPYRGPACADHLFFEINLKHEEFIGSVTAWTAQDPDNHIVLYDSEAPGTVTTIGEGGGAVPLSRHVVAVPVMVEMVLRICVCSSGGDGEEFVVEKTLGHCDREFVWEKCGHRLQVKVAWSGVLRNMRLDVWERIAGRPILR